MSRNAGTACKFLRLKQGSWGITQLLHTCDAVWTKAAIRPLQFGRSLCWSLLAGTTELVVMQHVLEYTNLRTHCFKNTPSKRNRSNAYIH